MSIAPARRAALAVLGRVRRDEAFSGAVLAHELRREALSSEDAGLATRLTYGVLAAEGVLDEALARHVKGSLEPRVRDALRLAAFEMLFGRAPTYAVVDQAVSAVRRVRPAAAGLANAVLRKLAAEAAEFPWGDPESNRDALARLSAHPRWIVDLVLADLGEVAGREMLISGMQASPSYIRLEPFVGSREETLEALVPAEPVESPPDPDCYRLEHPAAAYRATDASGWFAMDAAAQLAPRATRPAPGERIVDVGAGRGNKTLCLQVISMRSGGPAHIVALDSHAGKCSALERRLLASAVPDVEVRCADGTRLEGAFPGEQFDAVLVDAPCSGLGTLRRYPEKRWRLEPDSIDRMAELQLAMVKSAAGLVGPGGRVVYSTCSVSRRENDQVVDEFLASDAGEAFVLEPLGDAIPAEWSGFTTGRGCFQSWPTSEGPDGHYVALLRRVQDIGI